jgi:hypothetical protein
MALATVTVLQQQMINGVPCFLAKIQTQNNTTLPPRWIPLSDALNLETTRDHNRNLVSRIDPIIHSKIYAPKGDKCRTCTILGEPCASNCPYDLKYNGKYTYVLTKHIPGEPNSLILVRGLLWWHIDNNITDLILRPGVRLDVALHHVYLGSYTDCLNGHRMIDPSVHSSLHSRYKAAENYLMLTKLAYDTAIAARQSAQKIIPLKIKYEQAKYNMAIVVSDSLSVKDSPNLVVILNDYRTCIRNNIPFLPIQAGNYTSPQTGLQRNQRSTKAKMIQSGRKPPSTYVPNKATYIPPPIMPVVAQLIQHPVVLVNSSSQKKLLIKSINVGKKTP